MKPLVERLADELAWWINWAHDSESVPRRSFESARRDGIALLREVDPRRVGEQLRNAENASVDAVCRCGHVNDVHNSEGDCTFPGCSCGLFVLPLGSRSS